MTPLKPGESSPFHGDATSPYGCYNREIKESYLSYDVVLDETTGEFHFKTIKIPHRMTTECQYSKHTNDPRCFDCKNKE